MTLLQALSLQDAIQEALDATGGGTNHEVVVWLQTHRRKVLDANALTIEISGLNNIIRTYRKKGRTPKDHETISQICMDLGLGDLDLDLEISVPSADDDVDEVRWEERNEATVDDLDLHIMLMQDQHKALATKIDNEILFRQAAAAVVPGRTDIPVRELRRIARERMQ
jgi:hypothetical protein